MFQPHWELTVLSRAVAYTNLSGAAHHVGLSQPQLSRIVAKLEKEFGVILLDRTARRKSAWTPTAYKLAEVYAQSSRKLESDIQVLVHDSEPQSLRIGTLEGMIQISLAFSRELLAGTSIQVLELQSHDLNRLEELFLAGEFDVIFSGREPGRKKFRLVRVLGYQSLDVLERSVKSAPAREVMSSFEFGTRLSSQKNSPAGKVFVSNSLEARRLWLSKFGGRGAMPSAVRPTRSGKQDHEVLMIGSDLLSPGIEKKLREIDI